MPNRIRKVLELSGDYIGKYNVSECVCNVVYTLRYSRGQDF